MSHLPPATQRSGRTQAGLRAGVAEFLFSPAVLAPVQSWPVSVIATQKQLKPSARMAVAMFQ